MADIDTWMPTVPEMIHARRARMLSDVADTAAAGLAGCPLGGEIADGVPRVAAEAGRAASIVGGLASLHGARAAHAAPAA